MQVGSFYAINPTVNFASRAIADAGVVWGPRIIPDCQFFYVISGESLLQLGPEQYLIKQGEAAFFGADSPHILSVISKTDYFSIHFSWNEMSALPVHPGYHIEYGSQIDLSRTGRLYHLDIPGVGEVHIPHHLVVQGIQPVLMRIFKVYQEEQFGYPLLLRALLTELIVAIVNQQVLLSTVKLISKIKPVIQAVEQDPLRNWSVRQLAELCGYHPSYLTKLFHDEMGVNPKQYLIYERIKQAKQELLKGDSIELITQRLGYNSIHYFSNNFKKETGLSPSEFRQMPSGKSIK